MFSKTEAPKVLLLIPVTLLVMIVVLAVMLTQNLRYVPVAPTNNESGTENQPDTNTGTNQPPLQPGSGNPNPSQGSDINAIMHKVPKGYYPANQCPEALVKEGTSNNFAIDKEEKYSLTAANATWIKDNCPGIETLTY